MKNPVMLYKLGTEFKWHDVSYDTVTVSEDDIESYTLKGWFNNPSDCMESNIELGDINLDGEVTRKEMEIKAKELGIKFNHKTTDESLMAKIEEALNVVD